MLKKKMLPFILPVKIPCRDYSKDVSVSRTPLPEIKPTTCVLSAHTEQMHSIISPLPPCCFSSLLLHLSAHPFTLIYNP